MTFRKERKWLWVTLAGTFVAVVVVIIVAMPSKLRTAIAIYQQHGYEDIYSRLKDDVGIPNIRWQSTAPENVGLSSEILEKLRSSLAASGTNSLLVARDGQIVLEWYAPGHGQNRKHGLAAATKGIVGSVILFKAVSDGIIGLDDRVAKYVPSWRLDTEKSNITIRHLASHSSGMGDLRFDETYTGWKENYVRNPDKRFKLALDRVPILYEPGSQLSYSGVGFYVLAYTIGTLLKHSADPSNLKSFLRDRIMEPLGIPTGAWNLSYGDSYEIDDMELYAIGSGASYTARAAARIGQLFVQNGEWEGRQLIDPMWVSQAFDYAMSPPNPAVGSPGPSAGLGWWVNSHGFSSSLPQDAAIAAGGSHQILLIVPSLQLVAVRFGESLEKSGDDFWQPFEEQFFSPMMSAFLSEE